MKLKRYSSSFQPLATALNELAEAIERVANRTFFAGKGLTFTQSEEGITVDSLNEGGVSAVEGLKPFDLLSVSQSGGNITYKVVPGTIAGFIPSNIFSEFTVSATGTHYFKLKWLSDGRAITSVTIEANSTAPTGINPTLEALPTTGYGLFACVVNGVAYRTIGDGNPTLFSYQAFEVPRAGIPAVGFSPYQKWFSWCYK